MRTTLSGAVDYYAENAPKGEYVLVIEGKNPTEIKEEEIREWEKMSLADHMKYYEDPGLDRKEAMKKVAADRGVGKREIYSRLLEEGL